MDKKTGTGAKIVSAAPYILIAVYAFVTALTLFMNGDDYIWYYLGTDDSIVGYQTPNGRYFSNFLTVLIVRYPAFRLLFIPAVLFAFVYVVAKLFDIEKKTPGVKLCFSLASLILIPSATYCETILWQSGFCNYVFSAVLTLIYFIMLFKVLFLGGKFKAFHFVLFPVLALSAGLCVEHIAIYDIVLGIASIVLLRVRKKKFYIAPVLYLISACAAAAIMFTNGNYSQIADSGDELGTRTFYFSFSDFFYNAEVFVVPHFLKQCFVINIIITASFLVLYRFRNERFKASKYAPICICIVLLYTAYSVFYSCFAELAATKPDMKIRGLEFAFTFAYIVALMYLIWVFFDGDKVIRLYFYICSAIMLMAPFTVINPVTARCFFENYVFWIILSGELFFTAVSHFKKEVNSFESLCVLSFTAFLTVFILGAGISNKYYNDLRFDFIKMQIDEGINPVIQIIDLPYQEYTHDDLIDLYSDSSASADDVTYYKLICKYYGIDGEGVRYMHISPADYYLYNNK